MPPDLDFPLPAEERDGTAVGFTHAEGLERTEELAQLIALTPTDLIMMTKRSINRQFEVMGFKTGIAASVAFLFFWIAGLIEAETAG